MKKVILALLVIFGANIAFNTFFVDETVATIKFITE